MAVTEQDQQLPWHLRGNWAPVSEEVTATRLEVEGNVPAELSGTYVRTGPNPKAGWSQHWFFGDGMLHGVRLDGGTAQWYRNRFVRTRLVQEPDVDPMAALGDLTYGTANTHVVRHAGRVLALEEGHFPWEISTQLDTVGCHDFHGRLQTSMTAHPKICPVTGELLMFSYFALEPPFLTYHRVAADGRLVQTEPIDIPNMVMMHDFNVTENHAVFMDLPLVFKMEALEQGGLPFRFDPDAGARLGVMPRNGTNADVVWHDIDPCYVFHPVNAHEADGHIVLHVSRQASAMAESADDYSTVGRLYRWTIDTDTGKVVEEQVDNRPADFGRVDDRKVGQHARYGYLMAMAGDGKDSPEYGEHLYKYDLVTGECLTHDLGRGVKGGEPVFAPASPDAAEDEGWVMAIVHDENAGRSKLIVVDARDFEAPPVATVHLPQRVPYGAHGSWLPDEGA